MMEEDGSFKRLISFYLGFHTVFLLSSKMPLKSKYFKPDEVIRSRFKNMSPERKLELSLQLYYSARELKKAAIKTRHPDWSEERVEKEVKEKFSNART